MTCKIEGNLTICGGFNRKNCHYFTKDMKAVLFLDSLWYEPTLVSKLIRKKYERIDLFVARVKKKLGFMPLTHRGWWRVIAMPQIRAMKEDQKKEAAKGDGQDGYAPCLTRR